METDLSQKIAKHYEYINCNDVSFNNYKTVINLPNLKSKNIYKETLGNKKSQKIAKKYECKICDYKSFNKYDFDKHLSTLKHKNRTLETSEKKSQKKSQTHLQCKIQTTLNNLHVNSVTRLSKVDLGYGSIKINNLVIKLTI